MIAAALNHLSVLPAWVQQPILVLIGLALIASLAAVRAVTYLSTQIGRVRAS
jgi:hypothetical protein